jgi:hypothetical protein
VAGLALLLLGCKGHATARTLIGDGDHNNVIGHWRD